MSKSQIFSLGVVPPHLNAILPEHKNTFLQGITRGIILCVSSIGLDQASLKAAISSFMSVNGRYLFPRSPCLLSCISSILGFNHTEYNTLPSTPITTNTHTVACITRLSSIDL
ncbi:hypothetical protein DsansV1_C38g0236121 [Dioscorea sansibarensis]